MSERIKVKAGETLEAALLRAFEGMSKTRLKTLLRDGRVSVNGVVVEGALMGLSGAEEVVVGPRQAKGPRDRVEPPFPILFEDEALIAVEKPAGLLSIGTENKKDGTLYSLLNEYLEWRTFGKEHAYIAHRLDREVSGVVLFTKSTALKQTVMDQWPNAVKTYMARVEGLPPKPEDTLVAHLRENRAHVVYADEPGKWTKEAVTHYRLVKKVGSGCLLEVRLGTGRHQQIRAQLSGMGCPIAGDKKYGAQGRFHGRIALHAASLEVAHPVTGERLTITSPLPGSFHFPG
ncbi:MAG: RluA family pseudouridine synthase [Planctomycetota bacterium]